MKAAIQLHKPLMHQGVWNQHENTFSAAGEVQSMQDQTGFDSFTKAHFIRQQHAGNQSAGDLASNVHLMRQQVHTTAHEATHGRLADLSTAFQRLDP